MKKKAKIIFGLGTICVFVLIVGSAIVGNQSTTTGDGVIANPDGSTSKIINTDELASDPLITKVPSGIETGTPKPLESDPVRGAENPIVTIVEFADFDCAACKDMTIVMEAILDAYPNEVQHVWKDFPIPRLNEYSEIASMAARCAQDQDAFWEYHDKLFLNQEAFAARPWISIADELSLNQEEFTQCIDTDIKKQLVVQGYYIARLLDIDAAPSYYINDTFAVGPLTYDELKAIVDQEIAKVSSEL